MSKLIDAIETANIPLMQAGLPRYDQVVELLQLIENKLEVLQSQHSDATDIIGSLRANIKLTLKNFPYP